MTENTTTTTTPASPTVTHQQQMVAEILTAIDAILATTILPMIEKAEASGRKIAGSRTGVPDAFIATAVGVVEQSPELSAGDKLDPVAARDKLQSIEAVRPLYLKFFTITRRLNFLLLWLKDSLGADSLQVLRIAKEHARDGRSPIMAAHVANLKRALGKRVPTKAEREERRLARMMEAVAELQQTQEVQKAA